MSISIVGNVNKHIEKLLALPSVADNNIYISSGNLKHMQSAHPEDYKQYGSELKNILKHPDYVGQNPRDGSIEYVKEFVINDQYVKVAVRLSGTNRYYARSLYVLNNNRVKNYISKGTLKKI